MLHQLAARAVITDYENGVLDDDRILLCYKNMNLFCIVLLFDQMLHQLAARAVITDYENGVLGDDRILLC